MSNRAWVRVSDQPFRAMITHAGPDTQNFIRDGPESSQSEKFGRSEFFILDSFYRIRIGLPVFSLFHFEFSK